MADRYWITGGSGTWDGGANGNWSSTSGGAASGALPTSSDDVFFDASSGSATITMPADQPCNSITFAGFNGTINFAGVLGVNGNVALGTTATLTALKIQLNGSATGKTITNNSRTLPYLDVYATGGGEWTMQDAATITELRLNAGTLKFKSSTTSTIGSVTNSTGTGSGAKYLLASTPGSAATLTDSSGTNSFDYVTITDITVTGGATWNPGANSVNNGGNLGWAGWDGISPLLLMDF